MPKKPTPLVEESHHSLLIVPELERERLDKALTALLQGPDMSMSRARLQALLAEGRVTHNGKPVRDASRKVKTGEIFDLTLPPPLPATPEAQAMDLTIVFEDKDLLVINKPVGMVVHPAPGNRDKTLVNALLAHCGKSLSGIGGVARPGIVHRLDKDTSGLLVVAKNDHAHRELTNQFADRSLSRTYQALVWGTPSPRAGKIEGRIGRHPGDRKKMAVTGKGREAVTHYKLLETFDKASLLECKLETGRTHQIRVHLASLKHPVIGDPVYGKHFAPSKDALMQDLQHFSRQALHAAELRFTHPRSGKRVHFTAPLPKDMAMLLKHLRRIR